MQIIVIILGIFAIPLAAWTFHRLGFTAGYEAAMCERNTRDIEEQWAMTLWRERLNQRN